MGNARVEPLPREESVRRASRMKAGLTVMTVFGFLGFFALAWQHRVGVTAHAVAARPTPRSFFGVTGSSGVAQSPPGVSAPTASQGGSTPVTTTNVS
ncbi:MAG: hypothetical protein OWU84_00385 [Firmicutes bacterium]|nr:hypothetical protein [Bacillota bacterium]